MSEAINFLARSPVCRESAPADFEWRPSSVRAVYLFGPQDYHQALKVLKWSSELGVGQHDITLITDEDLSCDQLVNLAHKTWRSVDVQYISPINGVWPTTNNHAFRETCRIMAKQDRPWLLWEPDMIPASMFWLKRLDIEYNTARKPFMGNWVDHYDLMNGGGIYPADTTKWFPEFFNNPLPSYPYDLVLAPQIVWFMHPANHMMLNHFFSRKNGRPNGFMPHDTIWDRRTFEWLYNHHTCLIHRDKTGATIDFLREKLNILQRD